MITSQPASELIPAKHYLKCLAVTRLALLCTRSCCSRRFSTVTSLCGSYGPHGCRLSLMHSHCERCVTVRHIPHGCSLELIRSHRERCMRSCRLRLRRRSRLGAIAQPPLQLLPPSARAALRAGCDRAGRPTEPAWSQRWQYPSPRPAASGPLLVASARPVQLGYLFQQGRLHKEERRNIQAFPACEHHT